MNNSNQEMPFVSALLVTRNEKAYVKKALMSLINQSYPKNKYEIIIVDGISTDGTVEIIHEIIKEYSIDGFSISIISNEKHILSSGWNLGIQKAKGEYVVRIDAHAEVPGDFIEKSVQTMLAVDAVCVGGKLISKPQEGDDEVVSMVLSSPFGVGNSSFRVSDTAAYTDTAVYGLYKKDIFRQVGLFDESLVRNQDIDLHSRIRKAGGKFYFNPEIQSIYYTRSSVKKMLRQAFGNGKWNPVVQRKNGSALSLRHMIPFAFVAFLLTTTLLGFLWKPFWCLELAVLVLHLLLGTLFALKKTKNPKQWVRMPFLFMMLHLWYGTGYLVGLFQK